MTKPKTIHLWPVEGRSLPGVPAAEVDTDTETAAALVATGAFTTEPPASEPETEG
jgi:hypothetical protein